MDKASTQLQLAYYLAVMKEMERTGRTIWW